MHNISNHPGKMPHLPPFAPPRSSPSARPRRNLRSDVSAPLRPRELHLGCRGIYGDQRGSSVSVSLKMVDPTKPGVSIRKLLTWVI